MLNHRAEAVFQAWQAENTGVLITTACSQGGSSMPEGTNKIRHCAPSPHIATSLIEPGVSFWGKPLAVLPLAPVQWYRNSAQRER